MKVRFGPCVLDSGAREVRRGDAAVHLSPKAFDVLEILVARRPNVVSKDVLLEEVWPGKVVEEANLAIVIGEIRKALGDDPRAPAMVITVPRRGYRFAVQAEDVESRQLDHSRNGYLRWWLAWKDKTLPLREGENLVGRHPASDVWIGGASVSRTHAAIVASQDSVIIHDRGSRNGTFVDGKRVSEPHVLVDGCTVTFGSEQATYREWSDEAAMGTEPVR